MGYIREVFPDVEVFINSEKPRKGTFNISVQIEDEKPKLIWDGHSKGPPRKNKWPDKDSLLKDIKDYADK